MRKLALCLLLLPFATDFAKARAPRRSPPHGVLGTYVRGPERLSAGAPAALRIATHASTSESASEPFPDVDVEVTLFSKERRSVLYRGHTDAAGVAEARFVTPDWPDGDYSLRIEAHADGRHDVQTHTIDLAASARLLLETDKPLYQPAQIIHLKAIAQRPIDGRPVSARQATFLVFDPRNNEVFRKSAPLSEFGVSSADFPLADEITTGNYRARVEVEGAVAGERSVSVERYVLPKFKLAVESDRAWYAPGDRAKISVDAHYFFGKPVAGGTLTLHAGSQALHAKLDAEGKSRLELEVPRGESNLRLRAEVIDGAQHREESSRELIIAADPVRLELTTESQLAVPGADNRAWLVAARPDGAPIKDAEVELRVDGQAIASAHTDTLGVAQFDYRARRGGRCTQIEAGLHQPGNVEWTHKCQPFAPAGALRLRTDRALYASGQPIAIDLEGLGWDGPAFVDIEKDGQLVDTAVVKMAAGHGAITLAPDARRFGTLALVAYRVASDGQKVRDSRLVYVERPSALKLELTAGNYRPGETGRLHVRVLDEKNAGVRASVGLVMVDQSLLAMRAMQPQSARLFFTLAEEARRPTLSARPGGYTLDTLVDEGAFDDLKQEAARILLSGAVPPSRSWETDPWTQRRELRDARLQKLANRVEKWAEEHVAGEAHGKHWVWRHDLVDQLGGENRDPWGHRFSLSEVMAQAGLGEFQDWAAGETDRRLQAIYVAMAKVHLETTLPKADKGVVLAYSDLEKLAADGKLDKSLLVDPWGRPWRIADRKRVTRVGFLKSRYLVASSGPDGVEGNSDDLYAIDYSYARPLRIGLLEVRGAPMADAFGVGGLGLRGVGAGGGGFGAGTIGLGRIGTIGHGSGSGTGYGFGGGSGEARVRRDFPETMLWVPELLTDERGEASLDVAMADSITTWQLAAEAIANDGRIASGTLDVRVFQDFFADLDLPPAITQHDELAVPVAVYNYLPNPQRVTLTLDEGRWFTPSGDLTQTIDLAPQQVGVRYFKIKVNGIGHQKLLVRAKGTSASDAIEKSVDITPDGTERAVAFQDRLDKRVVEKWTIPADAIADASLAQLKIYPSMATHVIEGLDSMLRMPGGCFEQTSSSNYPNALILDYLRRSKKSTPEVEKKAQAYLQQGYQRLLSFEVAGGGFSWFGSAPANKILTAYGIEEFSDMSRVFNVDRRVIERTQRWLVQQQKPDGSWAPDTQFINEGATNHFNNDVVRITAYIAVALKHTGWRGHEIERAIDFVKRAPRSNDPYTLALVSELLSGDSESVLDALWAQRQDQPKTSSFTSKEKTPTYGDGKSGTVETTALAAYAMLQQPAAPIAKIDRAVGFLLTSKDTFGNWYSTQATILSLKALLSYGEKAGQRAHGNAIVMVDGQEAGRVRIAPDVEALQVIDLPRAAQPGEHAIEVRYDGQGAVAYQMVGRWWEPKHAAQPSEDVEVATRVEKADVKSGGILVEKVQVTPHGSLDMPIVTAGLPPGFDVDGEELDKLVKSHVVDKVQHGARELTFYLTRIDKPITLELHLTSRFPEKVQLPAPTVYEYYKPERRASGAPLVVTVNG